MFPPMFPHSEIDHQQLERDVEHQLSDQPGYLPFNFVMYGSVLMSALWKRIKSARAEAALRQPAYAPALDEAREIVQQDRRLVALPGDCLPEQS